MFFVELYQPFATFSLYFLTTSSFFPLHTVQFKFSIINTSYIVFQYLTHSLKEVIFSSTFESLISHIPVVVIDLTVPLLFCFFKTPVLVLALFSKYGCTYIIFSALVFFSLFLLELRYISSVGFFARSCIFQVHILKLFFTFSLFWFIVL